MRQFARMIAISGAVSPVSAQEWLRRGLTVGRPWADRGPEWHRAMRPPAAINISKVPSPTCRFRSVPVCGLAG